MQILQPPQDFACALSGLSATWLQPSSCLLFSHLSRVANAQDASGKRLALVVGNSAYSSLPPLKKSAADAKLIQKSLTDLGFDVTLVEDASKQALEQSLATLRDSIVQGSTVVVYFAGYGIQVSDQNYLAPVDVKVKDALDLPGAAVSTEPVLEQLDGKGAAAVVLILDASRENPFAKKKIANSDAVSDGLARISAVPPAMLVAFSTAPGGLSQQGSGDNSPYADGAGRRIEVKGQERRADIQADPCTCRRRHRRRTDSLGEVVAGPERDVRAGTQSARRRHARCMRPGRRPSVRSGTCRPQCRICQPRSAARHSGL